MSAKQAFANFGRYQVSPSRLYKLLTWSFRRCRVPPPSARLLLIFWLVARSLCKIPTQHDLLASSVQFQTIPLRSLNGRCSSCGHLYKFPCLGHSSRWSCSNSCHPTSVHRELVFAVPSHPPIVRPPANPSHDMGLGALLITSSPRKEEGSL